ncbi:hypothetical protein GGU10DRAFT_336375 [Lentinula aff. detonsa]|uniref:Uncharacterized protein n=1 Tax=Lentinula aff. detonsa TaxID=2804958 RepID=A0AA38KLB5_9AGAR|nr:hypothetical protein GGU10DRAFT_336375 [Lentinula aff. detonsa]
MASTSTETLKGKAREVERDPVEDQVAGLMNPINENAEEETSPGIEYPDKVLYRRYQIEPLKPISDYYKGDYSGIPQSTISQNPEIIVTYLKNTEHIFEIAEREQSFEEVDDSLAPSVRSVRIEWTFGTAIDNTLATLREENKVNMETKGGSNQVGVVPVSRIDSSIDARNCGSMRSWIDSGVGLMGSMRMIVTPSNSVRNSAAEYACLGKEFVENFLIEIARNSTEKPLESEHVHSGKAYQGRGQTSDTIPVTPESISQFRQPHFSQADNKVEAETHHLIHQVATLEMNFLRDLQDEKNLANQAGTHLEDLPDEEDQEIQAMIHSEVREDITVGGEEEIWISCYSIRTVGYK